MIEVRGQDSKCTRVETKGRGELTVKAVFVERGVQGWPNTLGLSDRLSGPMSSWCW
jgi:hypothetical protein